MIAEDERWLTRDECIDRYHFDPTGYPEAVLPSKLSSSRRRQSQRVWLESAIAKRAEIGPDAKEKR